MKRTFLVSLFFLGAFCSVSFARTLAELRNDLRININDTRSDRYRYSNATLNQLINDAQNVVVNATWLSLKTTSYVLSRGTTYYSLPADYLAAQQVDFSNASGNINLEEQSLKALANYNINWRTQGGKPAYYYVDASSSSSNLIVSFIPIPNSTTSTGTVTMQYFSSISSMTDDSDLPFDGKKNLETYDDVIVFYATIRIKGIERKFDDANFYTTLYTAMLSDMRSRLGMMPNYKPGISK
jgi:hypothetical protein